jgi:hypothetical protein
VAPNNSEPKKGLTKTAAVELAEELIRALQSWSPSGEPPSKDHVAILTTSGARLMDGKIPTPTEDTPLFFRELIDPLIEAARQAPTMEGEVKQFTVDLIKRPLSGAQFVEFIAKRLEGATATDVNKCREYLKRLTLTTSDRVAVRKQLVASINKSMRGKPGPTKGLNRDDWDRVLQASNDLRPAVLELLTVAEKNSTKSLATVIASVSLLHPEWSHQLTFLELNLPLVQRALELAKIKRAKTRGKATKLADSLACQFVGLETAPSYSLQQVEEIRRSFKKS